MRLCVGTIEFVAEIIHKCFHVCLIYQKYYRYDKQKSAKCNRAQEKLIRKDNRGKNDCNVEKKKANQTIVCRISISDSTAKRPSKANAERTPPTIHSTIKKNCVDFVAIII